METSLRYVGGGGDSKSLRLHAKEKFPIIDANTFLQVHGELDTNVGVPSHCSALLRHYYTNLSANLGVGLQYDKNERFRYTVRGKKSFPLATNGLVSFVLKGRCDADKDFKERKGRGAAELNIGILDFQKDQSVRFKFGFEMLDKVPYFQIRENNWTLNATMDGKWNVRFDL